MSEARPAPAPWIGVLFLVALVATTVESLVLQRLYSTFTGGFLNPDHLAGAQVPLFLLASLWVDAAAAAVFLAPALWLAGRWRGLNQARYLFVAGLLCLLPLQIAVCLRFDVAGFVGDTLEYRLGLAVPGVAALLLAGAAAFLTGWWLLRRVPDRWVAFLCAGTGLRGWAWGLVVFLLTPVMLAAVGQTSRGLQSQLLRKTTGRLIAGVADSLTDFDGDAYGLVRQPVDGEPFDGSLHPFAVDRPANGIDENGIGGDLVQAGDFAEERFPAVRFAQRPDVVLFVLETFRADNLDAVVDGRPATPVLRRLVADGALRGTGYSHNGYTVGSLTHLFTGSLTGTAKSSLIDDFAQNGYETACISGEDESFGGIERITGMVRADHFVDARRDQKRRTNPSASAGSLTVPWTVVVRNVERFLETRAGKRRPLFLYVNLQDCHYPYVHYAMERILQKDLVTRAEITPGNRERLRRTYLNAVANVDRAVGRILDAFSARRGAPAFVVVGDHGESLFDDGVLGHGVRINGHQTRVPFLVSGLPVAARFPVGHADLRGLLRDALSKPPGPPTGRTDPGKWVFQFVGSPRSPHFIGAASAGGGMVLDLSTQAYTAWGQPTVRPSRSDLVTRWEQIVFQRWKIRSGIGPSNATTPASASAPAPAPAPER